VPPEGYLSGVAELCKKHDVLLICDEIQTVFFFSFSHVPPIKADWWSFRAYVERERCSHANMTISDQILFSWAKLFRAVVSGIFVPYTIGSDSPI
jgi:hypothetical protein